MDKAHEAADKELKQLEVLLSREYNIAWSAIKKEVAAELAEIDFDGLTAEQRIEAASRSGRLERVSKKAAEILRKQNNESIKAINDATKAIYVDNYNYCAERFNKTERKRGDDVKNIFDNLAIAALIDASYLRRQITSALATGLTAAASINRIVAEVKTTVADNLQGTVLIAKNTTTRAENKARQDFADDNKAKKYIKRWRSVGDNKTRPAHKEANGQEVDYDKPFIVGGEKMMYPGDYSMGASIKNTIRCRCVMILIEK